MKDKSIKVDEKTYEILDKIKENTGIPIKRIIRNAVEKYQEKMEVK